MVIKQFRVWRTGIKGTFGYRKPKASGGFYYRATSKAKAIALVSKAEKIPKNKLQGKLWAYRDDKGKYTEIGWGKNPKSLKSRRRGT